MTVELIVVICALITFLLGFFTAVIKWGHDASLEKYYRETVVKTIKRPRYLPEPIDEIPSEIIVDSRHKFSPLRTYLKKKIAQIRGKKIPPVILVFGHYSEEEQKAFLIEKAFASSVVSELLDLDFLESLILYLAYKHVYEFDEIEQEVKLIIRRDFEKSKYRDHMIRLDSFDFSAKVVLNPPPVKKPLLTNVILPMVREKEKELLRTEANLPTIQEWKSTFMTLINNLCSQMCAVLFIGVRPHEEYLEMLDEGLQEFDSLILSARGTYIQLLPELINKRFNLESSKPVEEQIMINCERKDVIGLWEFLEEKVVKCQWVIFTKPAHSPTIG